MSTARGFVVEATVEGVALELTGSGCATTTSNVVLYRAATFAYMLHRVNKWKNDRTEVLDLEVDAKGPK